MSTRCVINFCDGGVTMSKVYRHYDGYPEAVKPDLQQFFKDVKAQTQDTRFSDPIYLSAKFVVWQANQNNRSHANGEVKMLDFLGVGPCVENPGDIEFEYFLDCSNLTSKGLPKIKTLEIPY